MIKNTVRHSENYPTRSPDREANERFVHLRKLNIEIQSTVPRLVNNVTAFIRTDKDGQTYVSFAECDARDQFCRRTGRTIARRKWFQKNRVLLEEAETLYEAVRKSWLGDMTEEVAA